MCTCSSVKGVQECSRINKSLAKNPLTVCSTLQVTDGSFTKDQDETVLTDVSSLDSNNVEPFPSIVNVLTNS